MSEDEQVGMLAGFEGVHRAAGGLKGLVPDERHKDQAVGLARETREVERVVDQLAVAPEPRTIETPSGARVLR